MNALLNKILEPNWFAISKEQLEPLVPTLAKHAPDWPATVLRQRILPVLQQHDLFQDWLIKALPYFLNTTADLPFAVENALNCLSLKEQLNCLYRFFKKIPPQIKIKILSYELLNSWLARFYQQLEQNNINLVLFKKGVYLILYNLYHNDQWLERERRALLTDLFKFVSFVVGYLINHPQFEKRLARKFLKWFFKNIARAPFDALIRGDAAAVESILQLMVWLKSQKQPIKSLKALLPLVMRFMRLADIDLMRLAQNYPKYLNELLYVEHLPLSFIALLLQKKYAKFWKKASFREALYRNLHNLVDAYLSEESEKLFKKHLTQLFHTYKNQLNDHYRWLFALITRILHVRPSLLTREDMFHFLEDAFLYYRHLHFRIQKNLIAEGKIDEAFLLHLIDLYAEAYAADKLAFYKLVQLLQQFLLTQEEIDTFFQSNAFKRATVRDKVQFSLFLKALRYFYDDQQIIDIFLTNQNLSDEILFYLKQLTPTTEQAQILSLYPKLPVQPFLRYFDINVLKNYLIDQTLPDVPNNIEANNPFEFSTPPLVLNSTKEAFLELPTSFNQVLGIVTHKPLKIWVSCQKVINNKSHLFYPYQPAFYDHQPVSYKLSFHLAPESWHELPAPLQQLFLTCALRRLGEAFLPPDRPQLTSYQPFQTYLMPVDEQPLYWPLEVASIIFQKNMTRSGEILWVESIEGLFSPTLQKYFEHLSAKHLVATESAVFLNKTLLAHYLEKWSQFTQQFVDFIMKTYWPSFLRANQQSWWGIANPILQAHWSIADDYSVQDWLHKLYRTNLIKVMPYKELKFKNRNNSNMLFNLLAQPIFVISV